MVSDWKNSRDVIINFLKNDFDVVFNYIIMPSNVNFIKNAIKNINVEIKLVVLTANEETLVLRDKVRPTDYQMGERCLILLNDLKNAGFNDNNIFDTSEITIEDTAKEIMEGKRFLI